ncbi:piRNA biogenesis protein EXD1 [Lepisosteus oculatus]|uniref:piRNA biogenesis protein EXD1 n=1 Tax=Lepisosteus oculatus TaxID=7918 RepID=UPI00074045BE|nr:PREDICTED: exonuclease 3'-5' domain-containing protein 1 [Lepisosteus oculatus]
MDCSNDQHFLDQFKKKRVKLTVNGGSYVGTVQCINLNKTILLEEVVNADTGRKLLGPTLFLGEKIKNVELPFSKNCSGPENGEKSGKCEPVSEELQVTDGQLAVAECQPCRKYIIPDDDSEFVHYVVVDQFLEKFGPAIMHIKKQQVIGVGANGIGLFQHERLCWIQIATKNMVYLFDILNLGAKAFKNGLSMILENNSILKVVHDCRCISGCLYHQFGVTLTNVFDTQVADLLYFYAETGGFLPDRISTLQECINLHLKMPFCLSSLKIKTDLNKVWYMRPCPEVFLKVMALSVTHLLPLRLALLDALMLDYTALVDSYLGAYRDDPISVHTGYENTGLELPKELQKLESVKKQRRQWALKKYAMNVEGHLLRSCPQVPDEPSDHSTQTPGGGAPEGLEMDRMGVGETEGKGPRGHTRVRGREGSESTLVEGCCVSETSDQTGAQGKTGYNNDAAEEMWDISDSMKNLSCSARSILFQGNPTDERFQIPKERAMEGDLPFFLEESRPIQIAVEKQCERLEEGCKVSTSKEEKSAFPYLSIRRDLHFLKSDASEGVNRAKKPQLMGRNLEI